MASPSAWAGPADDAALRRQRFALVLRRRSALPAAVSVINPSTARCSPAVPSASSTLTVQDHQFPESCCRILQPAAHYPSAGRSADHVGFESRPCARRATFLAGVVARSSRRAASQRRPPARVRVPRASTRKTACCRSSAVRLTPASASSALALWVPNCRPPTRCADAAPS